jgi:hypothetical protein
MLPLHQSPWFYVMNVGKLNLLIILDLAWREKSILCLYLFRGVGGEAVGLEVRWVARVAIRQSCADSVPFKNPRLGIGLQTDVTQLCASYLDLWLSDW